MLISVGIILVAASIDNLLFAVDVATTWLAAVVLLLLFLGIFLLLGIMAELPTNK